MAILALKTEVERILTLLTPQPTLVRAKNEAEANQLLHHLPLTNPVCIFYEDDRTGVYGTLTYPMRLGFAFKDDKALDQNVTDTFVDQAEDLAIAFYNNCRISPILDNKDPESEIGDYALETVERSDEFAAKVSGCLLTFDFPVGVSQSC